ncbi:MAG TPA: UbiH/UbiF family hydroxylase [Rhodocyclaceae bacterium]|nr:UbiH/UbiF family hydroxylase [Rhodocyclaceae bacterium]
MDFDVLIVGGGLAGLSLAVALRKTQLSVGLVEGNPPRQPEGWDARIYAISPANAAFLEQIGAWQHLDAQRLCPVEGMEVAGDRSGRLDFSAYDAGATELAWIAEASLMQCELWESAKRQANLLLLCPARPQALDIQPDKATLTLQDGRQFKARLIVAADGADSWTRIAAGIDVNFKHYGQKGVVANFVCERPHRNTAFQWFRNDGILAWLPLPDNKMSMVWSTPDAHADELTALAPADLCARVAAAGEHKLGRLELITPAAGFPLRLMRAPHSVAPRLALIGDAAHAIHPLSGHGINLGYRDAATLAQVLADKPELMDCGDLALLRRYERARKEEVVALQGVTDTLHKLFTPTAGPLAVLRNLGLNLTNRLPVIKDALIRYALAS